MRISRFEILLRTFPDLFTELVGILLIIWISNQLPDNIFWPGAIISLLILIWLSLPLAYTLFDVFLHKIEHTEGILKSVNFDIENRMFGYYRYMVKNTNNEVIRFRSIRFFWKYRNQKVRLYYGELSHTIIKIEIL